MEKTRAFHDTGHFISEKKSHGKRVPKKARREKTTSFTLTEELKGEVIKTTKADLKESLEEWKDCDEAVTLMEQKRMQEDELGQRF